jgi:hypothetical protein
MEVLVDGGVMECWSIVSLITPLLDYSNTPILSDRSLAAEIKMSAGVNPSAAPNCNLRQITESGAIAPCGQSI